MKLADLGYNKELEKYVAENNLSGFEIGRVIIEHKERYKVITEAGEINAEITGNMRYSAKSREDLPAVGDWVAVLTNNSDFGVIQKILPRKSVIARQAIGKFGEVQIIAANIDYAFIVQSVNRDFSINRLERYLAICKSSKVSPIIVLTKSDLIDKQELKNKTSSIKARIKNVPVFTISNKTKDGLDDLQKTFQRGKTYCLLGSSGVGKSSLLNNLVGNETMKTDEITESTQRGKHVTSHRELVVLETGGVIIDNPGMREVGMSDTSSGLEDIFSEIIKISQNCKFRDCTHTNEIECAVKKAVNNGKIDRDSLNNYLKMKREESHFESSVAQRRKKDKDFGKLVKNYKNLKKKGQNIN